ncbi:MBL fold metallo-hydrolase [Candidatus Peregrinibacteria bacterium]|jgi:competence protein ComEC|nr:MBL fold metallo-hydrolase [Candidatus Peregrinibacteria bacterium]
MRKIIFTIISMCTITLFLSVGYHEYLKIFPKNYSIIFLDIELGDSILIKTPEGKAILIDTGSSRNTLNKISQYQSFFKKNIDVLVLSHGDSDHIGGATSLLKKYNIGHILFTGALKKSPIFSEFFEEVQARDISYKIIESKKDFILFPHIIFDSLYPFENISFLSEHGNNESLVFSLSFFGKKILFTGDIEKESENKLVLSGEDLRSDILKVPHHGSKTSSSESFLKAVAPQFAVVQAALKNKFKHPHKEIVERHHDFGVEFLQTGKEGDIIFCISAKRPEFWRCEDE